ncbi:LLM class flavin-dependent oxidoreductase [Mycobacterium sp. MUNTM1]
MSGSHIGVFLPSMSPAAGVPQHVVAAARRAEDLGFESVLVIHGSPPIAVRQTFLSGVPIVSLGPVVTSQERPFE